LIKENLVYQLEKTKRKILLLCLFLLLVKVPIAQIRFIKPINQPEYYLESSNHSAELKHFYFIPIFSTNIISEPYKFSILKMDKSGNIVQRLFFSEPENERGPLFNSNESSFWKVSGGFDTSNYVNFKLFNSELQSLRNIKVQSASLDGHLNSNFVNYLKLSNGDFTFILGVEKINLSTKVNYFYISKEGEIKTNKSISAFCFFSDYRHYYNDNTLWQLNDSSIITIAYATNCRENCVTARKLNLNGEEFFSKNIANISTKSFKKCGNRFYGSCEKPQNAKDTFVCFDENFVVIYKKAIPSEYFPLEFWDNGDNNDFRVRCVYDKFPEIYETVTDTSFSWQKLRYFSNSENDKLKDINGENRFIPSSDGGALFLCSKYKDLLYDKQVIIVKIDTGAYCLNENCYNLKENVIYPNPNNSDRLFLKNDAWQTITIYDMTGRVIHYYENSLILNNIDIKILHPGSYFVQINYFDNTVYNNFIRY